MFRCQVTGELSNPNEKPVKVVVQTREVQYKNHMNEVIGTGWEIVKEISVRVNNVEKALNKYGTQSQAVKRFR
jgi:hypothetical protein